ncbi:hypothetical protein [Nocardia sp. R6R-6]|uniref:hypothetical protein n=1 Tax=Nocardia sp. R6R-6 TaxID=3459303 RepID=UPI00403DA609
MALGPRDVIDEAGSAMGAYRRFTGRAESMVAGMLLTAGEIRMAVAQFEDLGADEVMLYCCGRDVDRIDRLVEVVS